MARTLNLQITRAKYGIVVNPLSTRQHTALNDNGDAVITSVDEDKE